jgi:hypothetical protein
MFQAKVVEKIKTHNLSPKAFFFFSKIVPFMRKCEKKIYCTAGRATDDEHAHCMPDTQGYKHTHTQLV